MCRFSSYNSATIITANRMSRWRIAKKKIKEISREKYVREILILCVVWRMTYLLFFFFFILANFSHNAIHACAMNHEFFFSLPFLIRKIIKQNVYKKKKITQTQIYRNWIKIIMIRVHISFIDKLKISSITSKEMNLLTMCVYTVKETKERGRKNKKPLV